MSWAYRGTGMPQAILRAMNEQLQRQKCSEPEETIKNEVLEVAETCLEAFPPDHPVDVEASGSQSSIGGEGVAVNQLTLTIKPLWGFLKE